jgi:uncharacterized protein (TIGR02145 family)
MNGGSGVGSIAPSGWHVPTKTELDDFYIYLNSLYPDVEGGKLKETGFIHWNPPNTDATNELGFNGIGSGWRGAGGAFYVLKEIGTISSMTEETIINPLDSYYSYQLWYDSGFIASSTFLKQYGTSIRLIKDDSTDIGTMTDIDGNIYNTVKIGTQVWMAANLKVLHYNDGTPITEEQNDAAWAALSTEAYCWYNNTPS